MTQATRLAELDRAVQMQRRKGDALAKRDSVDRALEAYLTACGHAEEALNLLGVSLEPDAFAVPDDPATAAEAAEWLGVRGGLLRRIGAAGTPAAFSDALTSYRFGAAIEERRNLPETYNRANAIKLALSIGQDTLLGQRDRLERLRNVLEQRLSTDEQAADDAWLWADYGDTLLLIGDRDAALTAYKTFRNLARTDSPATTLNVLHEVVKGLKAHGDPQAAGVEQAVADLEQQLFVP